MPGGIQLNPGQAAMAGSAPVVIASDQSQLITQDRDAAGVAASNLTGDSGQNADLVAGVRKETSFTTTTAQAVGLTDVSNYSETSVHVTVQGTSSTVNFQDGNDSANWVAFAMRRADVVGSAISSTASSNIVLSAGMQSRYLRLNVTGISAGTTAGLLEFFGIASSPNSMALASVALSGTSSVAGVAGSPSDAFTNANATLPALGYGMVFGGTTWERLRDAAAAAGAAGTGVLATEAMGFDGTNFQHAGAVVGDSGQNSKVVSGARKELTFSTTTAQAVASADVSNYRHAAAQPSSIGTSAAQTVQISNDNVNWTNHSYVQASNANPMTALLSTLSQVNNVYSYALYSRYTRVNVTGISAGTASGTVELWALGPSQMPVAIGAPGSIGVSIGTNQTPLDGGGNTGAAGVIAAALAQAYTGSAWVFTRVPTKFKTAQATASGNTALWTPAAGKKFRLMRLLVELTENAVQASGGVITISLQDASADMAVTFDVFVPAVAVTGIGVGFSSGWVDLGNGILSAAANNVLNINLSASLTAGNVRITCCGVEE